MRKQTETEQNYEYGDRPQDDHDSHTANMWKTPNAAKFTEISCERVLFADDTGIWYTARNEIPIKITTYNDAAAPSNFLVSWENVCVLSDKNDKQTHKIINGAPHPYSEIKCVHKDKILRRILTTNNNMGDSVCDRI